MASSLASATRMRPEIELLLCCARTCIDPESAERIQTLVRAHIDWSYLLRTALQHRIIPLLYRSLHTTCPTAIPKATLEQLETHFWATSQHNLFLTMELLSLLRLLEEQGLSAIPFKGPILAVSAYGDLALREFADLDILVHRQDFIRAKALLIAAGYRMTQTSEHEATYLQAQLLRHDGKVNVDLHYGIPPAQRQLDTEPFWERLEPICLAGTTVLTLSPEDHLLILCVNGDKERWRWLRGLCDVAEYVRSHPRMRWGQVTEAASKLQIKRILAFGLQLDRDLLGAALPKGGRSMATSPFIRILAAQWCEQFFDDPDCVANFLDRHSFLPDLYHVARMDSFQDRMWYGMTLRPKDRAWVTLPTRLSFLYYVLRPIRLVWEHGPRLATHLFCHKP